MVDAAVRGQERMIGKRGGTHRNDIGGPGDPSRCVGEKGRTEKVDEATEDGKVRAESGEPGEPRVRTTSESVRSCQAGEIKEKGLAFRRTRRST